jgi:hypothetical protein
LEVAEAQIVLDGAYGAFVMHALQNYLLDEPTYDGNAYAFSSTLLGGYLILYAHHLTAPAKLEGRPHCYITQLKANALRDDEVYLECMDAFITLRILSKRTATSSSISQMLECATKAQRTQNRRGMFLPAQSRISKMDVRVLDFYDCRRSSESEDEGQESQETDVGPAIFHGRDDADDAEVSAGLATSFTSSFISIVRNGHLGAQRRSKIPRSPPSPSSTRHPKTSLTERPTTRSTSTR